MPRKPPPAWHGECRALRAAGSSIEALAREFGRSAGTIKWICDENGERAAHRARVAASRARRSGAAPAFVAPRLAAAQARAALAPEAVMAAARAFAAGEIDRATLSARLRGER